MITTMIYHCVDDFASEYERVAPVSKLHESVAWLRYCDRRARDGMRYVVARGRRGELLGVTALRLVPHESVASPNYDVAALVWPEQAAPLPVPRTRVYPQLFSAVSGAHCLFRVFADAGAAAKVRCALASASADLADSVDSALAFAYLSDSGLAHDLARIIGPSEHGLVGAQTVLDVEWAGFEGYVAALPRRRRSHIRRERREFLSTGLATSVHESTAVLDERTARLQLNLAAKYGVAGSMDSMLTEYEDLSNTVGKHVVVFLARSGAEPVGVCICLRDGDALHMRSMGFDYARTGDTYTYFNLMFYEPICWGADNGVRRYFFGNGAYPAKVRRGCRLENLYAVVRWQASLAPACHGALATRERLARAALGMLSTWA